MKKKVCFVGITDKIGLEPFDCSTKSGMIIVQIMELLDYECEKINYVSYPPLNEKGRLRYPTKKEMQEAFPGFQESILKMKPDLLVVCGKMVAGVLKQHSFFQDKILVIYHPSYIYVYQRNKIEQYILETVQKIKEIMG